ncbi:hypothetical protein [Streptomyces wuyuanensis]|uniref:hypothetical protein n=1 Tax=Streptomyces wuyuanensis TaxID=1196353 RepID=UPI0037240EE0
MRTDGPPDGAPEGARRTRFAEWLVCGVLAAAVLLSAIEAFARPSAPWWPFVWQNAWTLSAVTLGCWAVLRTVEKADARESRSTARPDRATGPQDGDESSRPADGDEGADKGAPSPPRTTPTPPADTQKHD